MDITKTDYFNSPYLGVFCKANDNIAITPKKIPEHFEELLKEKLGVEVVKTTMAATGLIGVLSSFNNKRIIVSDLLYKEEISTLEDYFSDVIILEGKFNAVGNLITMNDKGAICSPMVEEHVKDAVGIKIAGTDLVGSVVFTTNKNFIAHIEATKEEVTKIEKALKVKGGIGTINFGDPYISSGMIGNKKALIVGNKTSGPELSRLDDIFL